MFNEHKVNVVITRAFALINFNIHNDIHKQQKFMLQTVLSDKSLTEDEKN